MRKGFTLIELIVSIIIIGLIGIIVVPTTNNVIKKSKQKAYDAQMNMLLKSAKEYVTEIDDILPTGEGQTYPVYLEELKENKLLDKDELINPIDEKEFKGCIVLTFDNSTKKYNYEYDEDCILQPAAPYLDKGMIPVNIENNGTVKVVDEHTKWYNYDEQEWANMVLVKEEKREEYKNADAGTVVTSSDILGYFVWIPRYSYKIPTSGTTTPSSIDIKFEYSKTPKATGNAKTEYFSHPGFTFGSEELNGIWVAKFETTGNADSPTVLPNVPSLRGQIISTQFATALKFNNYSVSIDAHMMKNTEWSAAGYLSHSTYGINKETRLNNNSNHITGCGGAVENAYATTNCDIMFGNNINDLPQSTTGNITGIFDMSGGSHEKVAANFGNILSSSGFEEMPNSKYYDLYDATSYLTACNGKKCVGDATVETKGWYGDHYNEFYDFYSWIDRGGSCFDTIAPGIFYTGLNAGNSSFRTSFRVVITKP